MSSLNRPVPIHEAAEKMARQRAEAEHRRAVLALNAIRRLPGLERVTDIELSLALGVYAPQRGKGGRALVSRWSNGDVRPDTFHLATLELIAEHALVLVPDGADGRRTLYKIVPAYMLDEAA